MGAWEGGIIIFNFQDVIAREDIRQMVTGASFFSPKTSERTVMNNKEGMRHQNRLRMRKYRD